MDLMDRYVNAVKFWLPRAHQADIAAEIRDDLRSKRDDAEARLSRGLSEDEVVAILKERGHPMLVAAGYLPPKPLVGPALLPSYWFVLRLALAIALPITFIILILPLHILQDGDTTGTVRAVWDVLCAGVFIFGVVTLVFAVIERYPRKNLTEWDPRRLPGMPASNAAVDPWSESVARLVMSISFSAGWILLTSIYSTMHLTGLTITVAPIWHRLFWPILILMLNGAASGWLGLTRPSWTRVQTAIRLCANAGTVIVLAILYQAGEWFDLAGPKAPIPGSDEAHWVQFGLHIAFIAMGAVVLLDTVQAVNHIRRPPEILAAKN